MCLPARSGFWTALPLLKLPRSAGPVLSAGVGAPPLAAASTSMPGAHHSYCSQPETSRRTPCYKCPLAAEPANCRPQPRDGPETEAVCTNAHSKGLPAVKAEWGLVPGTAGAGHKLGYCKCSLSVAVSPPFIKISHLPPGQTNFKSSLHLEPREVLRAHCSQWLPAASWCSALLQPLGMPRAQR